MSAARKYIIFGRDASKEIFDLSIPTNSIFGGSPDVYGKDEFTKRFGSDEAIVIKYWGVDNVLKNPISIRGDGSILIPCNNDDSKLIAVFSKYKNYLESIKDTSTIIPASQIDLNLKIKNISEYLRLLENKDPKYCINPKSLIKSSGTKEDYYKVIPKIFYILYQHLKKGEPLNTQKLFNEEYPEFNETIEHYLSELENPDSPAVPESDELA